MKIGFLKCQFEELARRYGWQISRNGEFGDQHVARTVEHLLLAERKRLVELLNQQALHHLCNVEKAPRLHLFRVFPKAILPVRTALATPAGEEFKDPCHFAVLGDFAQSDILDVRERNHYGEAVGL